MNICQVKIYIWYNLDFVLFLGSLMNEIAYIINPEESLLKNCFVLDLGEAAREGPTLRLISLSDERSIAKWRALAKSFQDKEAFAFLLKEELLFRQKGRLQSLNADSLVLDALHISPSSVQEALKLLAPLQNLFCQGKQLAPDLYGKTEFYYEGSTLKEGRLEVQGCLRWRETDIPLSSCEAIFPGKPHHWFVKGFSLKMIHTTVNWKKLKELKINPLFLEQDARRVFFDDLNTDDPDYPRLVLNECSFEEAVQDLNVYPFLQLKDRWGACADLWMDYGNGFKSPFHDHSKEIKDGHGRAIFKRKMEQEAHWEKDLLETDYIKKFVGTSHYYCPIDRVAKSLSFLLEMGWNIQDWQNRRVVRQTDMHLALEDGISAIAVKGRLQYEMHEADLGQVFGAFNRREHFVQLSPTAVGLLDLGPSQLALLDLAQECEWSTEGINLKKNRFAALEPLWEQAQSSPRVTLLKNKWQNFKELEASLPSSAFKGILRPYQQKGVDWLSFLFEFGLHGILADEMGLGKTVQVLAFLSRLNKSYPHLIVAPTSLLFNWRREIGQFLPSFSCRIHQGAGRAKTIQELEGADILLTSYQTLRLDLALLESMPFSCLILDEAQMIKNADTQTAQSVCRLAAAFRLSLTGTPVENNLNELWSHFRFLMPDLLGSKEQFEADLQASQADPRFMERIKRKTNPFLLRRRKQDVASDLPPRIDQVVWIEMGDEQRRVYDQLLGGFKSGLLKKVETEGMGKHRMEVLEAILRLRQVCCHPLLVSSLLEDGSSAKSAKFDAVLQDVETIVQEGHKVLIFSQFTSMLALIKKEAAERSWAFGYLDGSTKNREEAVLRFQNDPSQLLFLISLKAGGVGLNLTAADYVFLYDPWWNEAVEEQAINRAHRIGREGAVIAKRFIVAESIEEKMMRLKSAKRMMIDDVLDSESLGANFTCEDLQFLLS